MIQMKLFFLIYEAIQTWNNQHMKETSGPQSTVGREKTVFWYPSPQLHYKACWGRASDEQNFKLECSTLHLSSQDSTTRVYKRLQGLHLDVGALLSAASYDGLLVLPAASLLFVSCLNGLMKESAQLFAPGRSPRCSPAPLSAPALCFLFGLISLYT